MFLYFLRHASAGQQLSTAKKDEKRGLDKDGIEQCGYIGRALAALGVQVEIIVSSPLKRSTQTAALVGNEMGYEVSRIFRRCWESTPVRIPCCWWDITRTCANFSDA
jgi:phosphohistidine phosphatase SixA